MHPTNSPDSLPIPAHRCERRDDSKGLRATFIAWYAFALHTLLLVLFYLIMVLAIDKRSFRAGNPQDFLHDRFPLYQTDVVTLISAALVLIKLSVSACSNLTALRLMCLLLEKCGLTISEIGRIHRRVSPLMPRFESRNQFVWSLLTVSIFILSWPAQFAAPLASGSIAWDPVLTHTQTPFERAFPVAGPGDGWDEYNRWVEKRSLLVARSSAIAQSWPRSNFLGNSTSIQRHFPESLNITVNSTVQRILMPYFIVEELNWVQNFSLDAADANIARILTNTSDSSLALSITGNPMSQSVIGNVALMKSTLWTVSNYIDNSTTRYMYPSPRIFQGSKYVAVLVSRPDTGVTATTTCPTTSPLFGDLPNVKQPQIPWFVNNKPFSINCYMIAKIQFRAGAYLCNDCLATTAGIVETILPMGSRGNTTTFPEPIPDALVDEIFAAIPEVIAGFARARIPTDAETQGNLRAYTIGMLTIAYQATWNAMTERFAVPETVQPRTMVRPGSIALLATVSRAKINGWMIMNSALLVAILLIPLLHYFFASEDNKITNDSTLTLLTMDLTQVLDKGGMGLCNAVSLNEEDEKIGRLWLQTSNGWNRKDRNESSSALPLLEIDLGGQQSTPPSQAQIGPWHRMVLTEKKLN